MSKPSIIILHGAWHYPVHFAALISLLEGQGYEVHCSGESSYNANPATTTLQDDATFIKEVISKLLNDRAKEVILLLHSYGGMFGTEAATEILSREHRQWNGLEGGEVSLPYIYAVLLHKGEILATTLGGSLPPFIPVEEDGSCNMLNPAHRSYNDLWPTLQAKHTALLKPHPASAQTTPLANEGYRYVKTTYLLCEKVAAIPPQVQEEFVKNVRVDVKTEKSPSGHIPFLNMPEKVVDVVERLGVSRDSTL